MLIDRVSVRQVAFPLVQPYKLSTGSKEVFEPFLIEVTAEGISGWGECMVSEGYTTETRADSWRVALAMAGCMIGMEITTARAQIAAYLDRLPGICSAMFGALDMLEGHELLVRSSEARIPILAPCQATERAPLQDEIDQLLSEGYGTLKVKIGFDWQADLDRVALIQDIVAGRARIRLDANRGFTEATGVEFARRLQPDAVELFEQPCAADDWAANAKVAQVSRAPVMLDESIYGIQDIERAATIPNVGFVKLKLKKIGRLDSLATALRRIRELGMTPVLGDGVSLELACWMEACVAIHTVDNAGEMNGFLKARDRLLENPLKFDRGSIVLPSGYLPVVDRLALKAHTIRLREFSARQR